MRFRETRVDGAFVVELELWEDDRGHFARAWCAREFREHGLMERIVQSNVAFSRRRGTLRGMHYQVAPHSEAKLVRCTRGAAFDVVVDIRPGSPTQGRWFGTELTAGDGRMLYAPPGTAHGYLTLENDTELFYHVSEFYAPGEENGFRHDDPAFGIEWPQAVEVLSEKDASWPNFNTAPD